LNLLTCQEIARYLKVTPRTIREWTHIGFIPHIKIGKRAVRYSQEDIDKWLSQMKVGGRFERKVRVSL